MSARTLHTSIMGSDSEPAALVERLRDDLGFRRIRQGNEALERAGPLLDRLTPAPGAGVLVGLVAQWVDAGVQDDALLRGLLDKFPPAARPDLPLIDYLHLRMAESVLAMAEEDLERAMAHLRVVQSFEEELHDEELLAIANFWLGRCYRRLGRYEEATKFIERGEALALSRGYIQMAAIIQTTRSWLAFQKGKLHEAVALLRRAEEALNSTDDLLSRGNIQSAYGRIARRQGRYQQAVEYFNRAIGEYRISGESRLQLARTLLNLGFVERLVALDAQKELDRGAAARRTSDRHPVSPREARLRIELIRAQARSHLEEALAIYRQHHNHRGIAGVHINRGFLHLDAGDLECASVDGAEAFAHGSEKSDYIIMARARVLQAIVENTAVEEQVGDPVRHHEAAEAFAREAVNFAQHTENRRLLARAWVWQGLTFAAGPENDLERARECLEQAVTLLQPDGGERQYIWEELETLKTRVLHSRPIDTTLRAWSAGVVENKSFQQMTEEFARIVIPKVWEREGRKISRVAERLSISPKKVRRILHAAGVSERRHV